MKSLEMALNLSRQNLTRIVIEGKVLKCYRGDELFQEHSFEKISNLDCSYNQLTSLPDTLPEGLKELYCSRNQLTSLPDALPEGLKTLHCYCNRLTSLPDNLPRLKWLYCFRNQLTSLPDNLPEGLIILNCSENQLISLPNNLPVSLETLNSSYNQLTSLPDTLPGGLKELYCSGNPLKYVPFLPERPKYLFVPEEFEEKHSSERYPEYYQKQQRNRYLIRLFFSEMGFSDDFLKTELEKE